MLVGRASQLAEQAGVNTQTLRHYERRGLLPEPHRSPSGYRAHTSDAARTIRFIKRPAARLHAGRHHCDAVESMAAARIAGLDRRIAKLRTMRDALRQSGRHLRTAPRSARMPAPARDRPRYRRDRTDEHDVQSDRGVQSGQSGRWVSMRRSYVYPRQLSLRGISPVTAKSSRLATETAWSAKRS